MALRPNVAATSPIPHPRVIPAQVNFLTIYNPTLGDSDETEQDQIVFWAGKDEIGTSRPGRKAGKSPGAPANDELDNEPRNLTDEQVMNDRMRHIGLARGMVDFVRNFASDHPLDTIETDRSRIVLHELEKDWWILASIDLTRLPPTASNVKSGSDTPYEESQPQYDFSNREVSPAALLQTQLIKAHNLFLLHHASGLWELYHKLGRPQFCALLDRFWEKFARRWDVLLHANPAVDIFGDCIKLAGGGELGVGVGEEEWGSGEREVLEGFVERVDGLIECVVGRYGNAPAKTRTQTDKEKQKQLSTEDNSKTQKETNMEQWLGAGEDPGPADGIVFSGMGTLARSSLATISQWMETIFKHGESAYGVGENPASRPRQRRKRPKMERQLSEDPAKRDEGGEQRSTDVSPRVRSPRRKAPDWRRKAMENNATPPGIPAPLVGSVERSLDEALAKVAQRSASKSPISSPKKERSEDEVMNGAASSQDSQDESSSLFSMEGMKNVLTFGYGSSWTLNPSGFDTKEDKMKKSRSKEGSPKPSNKQKTGTKTPPVQRPGSSGNRPAEERLQQIDPTPEVSDEDLPFVQKLEQSIGRFIIGLSGDLENTEFNDSDEPVEQGDTGRRTGPRRIFLRTLTIQLANAHNQRPGGGISQRKFSQSSQVSKVSAGSIGSVRTIPEPKTSAAASIDGAQPIARFEKVQVAVYVHQPFIFVFLFELHTSKLTMPGFYRNIHHQLGPLQKPLLKRTDPTRMVERIATALNEKTSAAMSAVKKHVNDSGNAIYDLIYDPSQNTIRTSIPNIPIPAIPDTAIKTSSTISGAWYTLGIPISSSSAPSATRSGSNGVRSKMEPWTRVEALNVHAQILNTHVATRNPNELERTVKTARGWWVLWMKVANPGKEGEKLKEAFLVRKSADFVPGHSGKESASGGKSSGNASPAGRWLLRDQSREVVSGSNFSGNNSATSNSAKGVGEGVGIDARRWVEGLLSLTQ